MNHNDHHLSVGQIFSNLGSLEFLLRLFLAEANEQQVSIPKPGDRTVPLSFLTNRDSLSTLATEFNDLLTDQEKKFSIDSAVVDLRNALAHGRLLSLTPDPPFTLYRFGKAANGQVPIESIETINERWLRSKIKQTSDEMFKVISCAAGRRFTSLPSP